MSAPAVSPPVTPSALGRETSASRSDRTERLAARAHRLVHGLETWAGQGPLRSLVVKALVTVTGPFLVVVGLAMTVLPGPGLVVVALGMTLLAIEYPWARRSLRWTARGLSRLKSAVLPADASRLRRGIGVAGAGAFFVATFFLTTAITSYVGAHVLL